MAIFKGKTVNEAIEKGLKDLQVDKKHVDIKVLQEPSNGIFGIFGKEAEVEVIVLSDEELKKRALMKKLERLLYIGGGIALVLVCIVAAFFRPKETGLTTSSNSTTTIVKRTTESSTTVPITTKTTRTTKTTKATTISSVQSPTIEILTVKNNSEFAGILSSENSELAKQFAEKYYGRIVEFDGHVAHIAPHENYKTRYDILLYGGNYSGSETTNYSGVNLQFFNVATTSEAFSSLDGLSIGQNLHIKAQVVEYNAVSGLLRLEPVQVTAR